MIKGNIHFHVVLPSRPHLPNSSPTRDSNVAGTFTPLSRKRGKEVVHSSSREEGFLLELWGRMTPHYPPIKDALRMALHIMAALGEIKYKSHDLEAQLQAPTYEFY
ncbi:hypothetical protein F0562_019522 [Nyssa sinensis]|uniref:Uncharacterized protein n=1 Tax=Nyssa sinensis TaxID=561372 RepID=A0A5J5BQ47_9ASTE|nr:hypothetical protein F0562_019522 [Nyssa sinensis]